MPGIKRMTAVESENDLFISFFVMFLSVQKQNHSPYVGVSQFQTRIRLNGNSPERIKEFKRPFHFLLHSDCFVDKGTNMASKKQQAEHE